MENNEQQERDEFSEKYEKQTPLYAVTRRCDRNGAVLSSGYTIHQAGPAGTIFAYLLGAGIVYLVMLCLGELSVAMPVTGAFHTYAKTYIGPATGFTVAWLYWLTWAVALGSEFTAAGLFMQRWFPHTSVWMWSAVFALFIFY